MEMTVLRMIAFRPAVVIDDPAQHELQDSGGEAADPAKKSPVPQAPQAPEPAAPARPVDVPAPAGMAADPQPDEQPVAEAAAGPDALRRTLESDAPRSRPQPAAVADPMVSPGDDDSSAAADVPLEPGRWAELLDRVELSGLVYNVASHCELRQVDGDRVYLVLDEQNASLHNDKHAGRIARVLGDHLGRELEVSIELGVPRFETPAKRARRLLDERHAAALVAIESDPKVKLLLERFEGTIDRDSVAPIKH